MSGKIATAILAGLSALCLFMALITGGAFAQSACAPAGELIKGLTGSKYGEAPLFEAIINTPLGPRPIRMFANPVTGTWTILTIQPNGEACIAGVGMDFKPARLPGNAI